ncbi:hypothetical protein MA16_Dca013821 [Dendrobium catenatum]|uniref:Uncharacterized protein n=1 Tax=Dendrobium catenatum TaxID=906689 RepID=A0A2I0W8H1_9ASPA|nr:hypothetical protein MA16_Dca013821 [Dendrobium catenatum]
MVKVRAGFREEEVEIRDLIKDDVNATDGAPFEHGIPVLLRRAEVLKAAFAESKPLQHIVNK